MPHVYMTRAGRRLAGLLSLFLLAGAALAGEVQDGRFVAGRYGRLEISAPATDWVLSDRESVGDNALGGPVADLRSTRRAGSIYPLVLITAFRQADDSVTPDFILRASRDSMQQRGAVPGPVLVRRVNERKIWFFDAAVQQQGQPARLYYLLLAGEGVYFAIQAVAPEASFEPMQQQVDALLNHLSY